MPSKAEPGGTLLSGVPLPSEKQKACQYGGQRETFEEAAISGNPMARDNITIFKRLGE